MQKPNGWQPNDPNKPFRCELCGCNFRKAKYFLKHCESLSHSRRLDEEDNLRKVLLDDSIFEEEEENQTIFSVSQSSDSMEHSLIGESDEEVLDVILAHEDITKQDKKLLVLYSIFLESRMSQKKFKCWYELLHSPLFHVDLPSINVASILRSVPQYLASHTVSSLS